MYSKLREIQLEQRIKYIKFPIFRIIFTTIYFHVLSTSSQKLVETPQA